MSNSVNITGSDFGELTKALSTINRVAAEANAKIDSMFQLNFSGSKLFSSLDALNGKLAVARIRADGLATALKGIKGIGTIKVLSGGGSGGSGGGKSGGGGGKSKGGFWVASDGTFMNPSGDLKNNFASSLHAMLQADKFNKKMESLKEKKRIKDEKDAERRAKEEARQEELASRKRQKLIAETAPSNTLYNLTKQAWHRRLTAQNLFGFKSGMGLDPNGTGNPFMVSRFGNPGQMPLMSRFRVFQRPFPGSERNPFALGDAANIMNNGVYSAGRGIEGLFKGITSAGTDSVRALTGFTQIGLSFATSLGSAIPVIGPFVSMLGQGLMTGLDIASKALTFFVDSLSKAVGGIINFVTNLTLGVSGILSRAVQAASTLTELENAAKVYVGKGSGKLIDTSMDYQSRYGISATDSLRLMTRIAGQVRQTTSLSSDQSAQAAVDIFKQVAEAGSVLNLSTDDMGKMIQSMIAGRYTPGRRMGVTVSAPMLDQISKNDTSRGKPGTMFEGRTMSFLSEFKRQTMPFTGDLEKTQYEFANQQRKILGLFEGMFVQLGRVVEPFAKGLLIVSNTLLTTVYDKLKGFAEGAKASIEDIRAGGSGGGFGSALRSFVYAISRAGDYAYAFGLYLYDSRSIIGEWLTSIAKSIMGIAKDLIFVSSQFISALATVVESFALMLSPLGSFRDALIGVAKKMDWITGRDPEGDARDKFNAAKAEEGIFQYSLKEFQAKEKAPLSGFLTGSKDQFGSAEVREAMAKEVESNRQRAAKANSMIAQRNDFMKTKGFTEDQANVEVFGEKLGGLSFGSVAEVAGSIRRVAGHMGVLIESFDKVLPNVPDSGAGSKLLEKLTMSTEREAKFQPLPPMAEKGRLSSYFSPSAFRDEIAGSDRQMLTAAETTAANTSMLVEFLKPKNNVNIEQRFLPGMTTR